MRFFRGHIAVYVEHNSKPFWEEFYINKNGGFKLCVGRLVFWYKHLRNA